MKRQLSNFLVRIRPHWRKILLIGGAVILNLVIIFQLLYPSDYLVPFTIVDGVNLGGWQKSDAIKKLDSEHTKTAIPLYFGTDEKAYRSPQPNEIGLVISNEARINKIDYPWYLRIVPSSILWMHYVIGDNTEPDYQRDETKLSAYIVKELGDSCAVKPIDASLNAVGSTLAVVKSKNGGICDVKVVSRMLLDVKPQLDNDFRVTVPVEVIAPNVSDETARLFGDALQERTKSGVDIAAGGLAQTVTASELFSWIDFSVTNGKLGYVFNPDRAAVYLDKEIAPKVAVSAGTTTISTYDFVETSRIDGASGKGFDINATLDNLKTYLDGAIEQVTAAMKLISPNIVYTRSYSPTDTGLSALVQQYAEDHVGVYGVSMIELSGKNRRVSYNETKSFTSASTYKLFVAYSTLKRVEEGVWHWTDQITGGRDLSTCFDDMIVKSDNPCGEVLLEKIGYRNITNEANDIGCIGTSFIDSVRTTAADLALLLAELQSGQILTQQSSRDILINAMKRNIYRNGIPTGLDSMVVADKVGFLYGLLHDAAIVYSPNGVYVLAIMTDGSDWTTIADFAKQIEALRIQ